MNSVEDPRTRLLQAAHELFLSQGFAKTTIQQLVDHAGISKGAFYLHFRSKSEVMSALVCHQEDQVLEAIAELRQREDLTTLDKLRAQIRYQCTDLLEHRVLLEIFIKEADVAIDEEMVLRAQRTRVDWLRMQKDFLRLAFPEHDERHTNDLAVLLEGAIHEFSSYVLLEGVELDADRIADFLVVTMQGVVAQLGEVEVEPVITGAALPDIEEIDARLEASTRARVDSALETMLEEAEKLGTDERREVGETVEALRSTLDQDSPSRVVLQGLLANLREIKELMPQRRELAHELRIKLI